MWKSNASGSAEELVKSLGCIIALQSLASEMIGHGIFGSRYVPKLHLNTHVVEVVHHLIKRSEQSRIDYAQSSMVDVSVLSPPVYPVRHALDQILGIRLDDNTPKPPIRPWRHTVKARSIGRVRVAFSNSDSLLQS